MENTKQATETGADCEFSATYSGASVVFRFRRFVVATWSLKSKTVAVVGSERLIAETLEAAIEIVQTKVVETTNTTPAVFYGKPKQKKKRIRRGFQR